MLIYLNKNKEHSFLKKLFQGLCVLCAVGVIGCSKEQNKGQQATIQQPNAQAALNQENPQVSDENTGPLPDEEVQRLSYLWPEMQDLVSAPDAASHLYSAHQGKDIGTIFGEHYKGIVSIAERADNGEIKKISVIKEGQTAVIAFDYQPKGLPEATRVIAFRLTQGVEMGGTYFYEKKGEEGVWYQGTEEDKKKYSFQDMLVFVDGFAEKFDLKDSALLKKAKFFMSQPFKPPVKKQRKYVPYDTGKREWI